MSAIRPASAGMGGHGGRECAHLIINNCEHLLITVTVFQAIANAVQIWANIILLIIVFYIIEKKNLCKRSTKDEIFTKFFRD